MKNLVLNLLKCGNLTLKILWIIIFISAFFSNTSFSQPLKLGQSVVTSFDATNPLYNCVKVIDLRNRPPDVVGGNFWNPNSFSGANWTQATMGNVYGITLDDANPPNIFVARSTVYIGTPTLLPGLIYKINGSTWAVSNFVVKNPVAGPPVMNVNSIPNTGPGLGNICYDARHQQLFTTNHEDGKIYRIDMFGIIQSTYDPFTADLGTNSGFVERGERIWGIGVFGNSSTDVRVYYSRWWADGLSHPVNVFNEIWSVALNNNGEFLLGSDRLEITIPRHQDLTYSNPVSDIEFSRTGTMLLGERTMNGDMGGIGHSFLWAHESRVLEYPRNIYELYDNSIYIWQKMGFALRVSNSCGGVDFNYGYADSNSNVFSGCDTVIVETGDQIYNKPGLGDQGLVYGCQITDKNFGGNSNFKDHSHFIDLNGNFSVGDKTTPGDVDVYRRDFCNCQDTIDLWMRDDFADIGNEPNTQTGTEFWNSDDIWVTNSPTGTVHINPVYGATNYVRVRVRNKNSTAISCGGVLTLRWSKASSGLSWPKSWFGTEFFNNTNFPLGGSIGAQTIPGIASNSSTILTFIWNMPNPDNYLAPNDKIHYPGQFCLLARIEKTSSFPYGMTFPEVVNDLPGNIRKNNNIVMKNVDGIYVTADAPIGTSGLIGNLDDLPFEKEIIFIGLTPVDSISVMDKVTVSATLSNSVYQKWAAGGKLGSNILELSDSSIIILKSGAYITGLNLPANSSYSIGWKFARKYASDSLYLPEYNYDIIQRDVSSNKIDGGNRINMKLSSFLSKVDVTATSGTLSASYASLNLALAQVGVLHTGVVTVKINYSHSLNSSSIIGNSNFTSCKIFPTAAVTLTSSVANTVISLVGADNVTIDGRINGADGNVNSLNITCTNTSSGLRGIQLNNGANNNTVRNVNISIPVQLAASATAFGRCISIAQSTSALGGNNNNTVKYCNLSGGDRTLQTFGTVGVNVNTNTTFFGNKIRNFSTIGIFVGSDIVNAIVDSNEIYHDTPAYLGGATTTATSYVARAIGVQGMGNILIQNNIIHDLSDNDIRTTGLFVQGIITIPVRDVLIPNPITTVTLQNNIVKLVQNNFKSTTTYCLYIGTLTPTTSALDYNAKIYNNTSIIGGTGSLPEFTCANRFTVQNAASANSPSTSTYYNNVALNLREGIGTSQHVGMNFEVEANVVNVSDYNTAYSDGLTGTHYDETNADFGFNSASSWRDANCPDYEQHSANHPVNYDVNYQLTPANFGDLNGKVLASVPKDIFGNTKVAVYPYRGAVEGPTLKVLTVNAGLEGRTGPENSDMMVALYDGCTFVDYAMSYITDTEKPPEFIFSTAIEYYTAYSLRCLTATHIESWSSGTVAFSSETASYSFNNSSDIFGFNGTSTGQFFSGDINQDGTVDASDLSQVENDAGGFSKGCRLPTDINYDGIIDASDLSTVENSSAIGLSTITPCSPGPHEKSGKIKMNLNNSEKVRLSSDSKINEADALGF